MGSFRILDQKPVYRDLLDQPCAGGSLTYYISGTTTPKSVYGEPALTTDNGNVLTLDSSGRTSVDVWGDGVYRVVLKNSLGSVIDTQDNVQIQGDTFPTGTEDQFLSIVGGVPAFVDLTLLPDTTGHNGDVLTVVSGVYELQPPADAQTGILKQQTVTAEDVTTIDLSLGCSIILNQAVTITTLAFTNPPTTTGSYFVTIQRVKDATGTARLISNLGTLAVWPGGVPTLTQTTGAIDEIHIKFMAGVTKGDGTVALNLS